MDGYYEKMFEEQKVKRIRETVDRVNWDRYFVVVRKGQVEVNTKYSIDNEFQP